MRTRGLIVLLAGLLTAASAWGRGGGGCLEEGTLIDTPTGPISIEQLKPGAQVWAVVDGQRRPAMVQATCIVQPADYVEISVGGRTLRSTSEHPLQTGPGTFRIASTLRPGDSLCVSDSGHFAQLAIEKVDCVRADRPAYNLLVMPGGTYVANGVAVHNKGCFLPDTPIRLADGTELPISAVRPGAELLAFTAEGEIVHTTVRRIIAYAVDAYVVVRTEQTTLRVTREHPFYVGDGTFRTLEALKVGDSIIVLSGNGLQKQRILGLETVAAPTRVYNLQTDHPNTYFANGVAVHNKGGGCFPAGTRVRTPRGEMAIEALQPGDAVCGVNARGVEVATKVEFVEATQSRLLAIETDRGGLRTTAEHPLLAVNGNFLVAGAFRSGDGLFVWHDGRMEPAVIRRITAQADESLVYNLRVGSPHTFVADGFVVHNKGGGGFGGGGFHGGSGGGGGNGDPTFFFIGIGVFIIVVVVKSLAGKIQEQDEDLDYLYSRAEIDGKAAKTRKLLEFLSRVDQAMAPAKLEQQALDTFKKLQECWQARSYEPMQPLLMPHLYADHCSQLSGLIGDHEINRIDGLRIEHVDVVNVRYPDKEDEREFTALFTAVARDYYIDDRTQEFLRGDEKPARFQEFWTFQRQDGAWRLREIEQTRESDALREENFFEQFTDLGRDQMIYGDQAGQAGPAGPWLEKETETKATRIERLLNFLVQTDKLWDRQAMLERARQAFLHVTLARQQSDPAAVPAAELFPDVARSLQGEFVRLGGQGTKLEFRNLCVRKVELILVRNYSDNTRDEFTVRINAHAQRAVHRNGLLISQDPYVTPWTEYWTFGRLDNEWKLKAVEPPARGEEMTRAENVDQDSSPEQLQWYYRQTRAN